MHFAPAANWMNDPNGLIYWNDRYHLFYQYDPHGTTHEKICWGHAVSTDLVHWEDQPVALRPSPGTVDEDGCWSGRAIAHKGEVYLLYTGLRDGRQRPCLAKALDADLVRFEKLAGGPVISEEPLPGLVGFRDNALWRDEDGFHQLVGSGSPELGGCVLEYVGPDLVNWEYRGVFLSARSAGLPGTMWECPDLFQLGGTWFMVLSVVEGTKLAQSIFIEGALDAGGFAPRSTGRLDTGSRWYAPQSFDAPDGRRVAFGWLRENEEELPEDERGRVGVMSLPRELFRGPGGTLGMAPATELTALRANSLSVARQGCSDGVVTLEAEGDMRAVEVEVACVGDGAVVIDLLDAKGALVLEAAVTESSVEVATTRLQFPGGGIPIAGNLRLFYDDGICEVFNPAGLARAEIFHRLPAVRSVVVRLCSADGRVVELLAETVKAWELEPIWGSGATPVVHAASER